jgi:hypothetical protein
VIYVPTGLPPESFASLVVCSRGDLFLVNCFLGGNLLCVSSAWLPAMVVKSLPADGPLFDAAWCANESDFHI